MKIRRVFTFMLILVLIGAIAVGVYYAWLFNLIPWGTYTAEDFDIEIIKSPVDFNENGKNDYEDFLKGAKKDAANHPKYDSAYYGGGYPPDNIGVCTDVIWRAFKEAGYSLRDMVDKDINEFPEEYPHISIMDANIDFRRVNNLWIFFGRYGTELSADISKLEEWQPGDIVIFNDGAHIGMVSDKRNKKGQPLIIHNGGQPRREEDYLKRGKVAAHYRFDASKVPEDMLIKFEE